tara:strand:+ start:142 stop:465 length:324 start_codon:yes stop_codon:yes gene_type:complete
MSSDQIHMPTIDRALQVERYILSHRREILKIEHLLQLADHADLAFVLRHLLIEQCVTDADVADLLEAASLARGQSRKKIGDQMERRFLDDFKQIKRQRDAYKRREDS